MTHKILDGAQILIAWLAEYGIDTVFILPGLQIQPLMIRLAVAEGLQVIIANDEQNAGFMADGYARASGKIGVCISIGGPGAAKLVTPALVAQYDHVPVLFITGNVPASLQGRGAFQDGWEGGTNDLRLFSSVVRSSAIVPSVDALHACLQQAARDLLRQPFAPVHLSLPWDVQEAALNCNCPLPKPASAVESSIEQPSLDLLVSLLASARKILLLAGPRMVLPDAAEVLQSFAEAFEIPVVTTLSAKGILPENHPLSLGNMGYGGSFRANKAALRDDVELLLVMGADFNERDSLCWDSRLNPPGRIIVRVDFLPPGDRTPLPANLDLSLDCSSVLKSCLDWRETLLAPLWASRSLRREWMADLRRTPRTPHPISQTETEIEASTISLDHVVGILREEMPAETILVVDSGLHRIFAGQYWLACQPRAFFSACGLATMGWAIGAAIGIQIARAKSPVVVLTGDGCMRMGGSEIATMSRYALPIITVVCNNGSYGSVHARLAKMPQQIARLSILPVVNWKKFAESFGMDSASAGQPGELKNVLRQALFSISDAAENRSRPFLIDVATPLVQPIPDSGSSPTVLESSK